MRVYWELAVIGFKRYATYRGATIAGVFTNTVFGFMLAYIEIALFKGRGSVAGYDVRQAVTYVWLTQGLLMTVYIWNWVEIALRVRTGDIASDFQRPVDFQSYWLAQDLGRALYHSIFRGIPPALIGGLVLGLELPSHPLTWIWFALSVFLAVVVSFGLRFLTNLVPFWISDYRGVLSVTSFVWPFLAGLYGIPLAFLPPAFYRVVSLLPFAAMGQAPLSIFLQKPGTWTTLLLQAFWAIVVLAVGRLVLRAAERKLVVQGG